MTMTRSERDRVVRSRLRSDPGSGMRGQRQAGKQRELADERVEQFLGPPENDLLEARVRLFVLLQVEKQRARTGEPGRTNIIRRRVNHARRADRDEQITILQ